MCVYTHVHTGIDKGHGEERADPVSLNKFGSRVASHAQGSPLWFLPPSSGPSALLTFLKSCFWILDAPDSVFIHSVWRKRAVMQRREGEGRE